MVKGHEARIKFALRLSGWQMGADVGQLQKHAVRVVAADYTEAMDGEIFCPGCFTPLTRKPKEKLYFSNGRGACFAHLPRSSSVRCDMRTPISEGLRFATEDLAQEAVENGELVVVHSFMKAPPPDPDFKVGGYDQSQVEDADGPLSEVPLARHQGDHYPLPSKVSTVMNFCRRFDLNLSRYYVLPGISKARRLVDLLVDAQTLTAPDASPKLYFAKITSSENMGTKPKNIRMTWLKHHPATHELCLNDPDGNQGMKGIGNDSTDRILLVWSTVVESGIGLAFDRPGWGGYALLPVKYEALVCAIEQA